MRRICDISYVVVVLRTGFFHTNTMISHCFEKCRGLGRPLCLGALDLAAWMKMAVNQPATSFPWFFIVPYEDHNTYVNDPGQINIGRAWIRYITGYYTRALCNGRHYHHSRLKAPCRNLHGL